MSITPQDVLAAFVAGLDGDKIDNGPAQKLLASHAFIYDRSANELVDDGSFGASFVVAASAITLCAHLTGSTTLEIIRTLQVGLLDPRDFRGLRDA